MEVPLHEMRKCLVSISFSCLMCQQLSDSSCNMILILPVWFGFVGSGSCYRWYKIEQVFVVMKLYILKLLIVCMSGYLKRTSLCALMPSFLAFLVKFL